MRAEPTLELPLEISQGFDTGGTADNSSSETQYPNTERLTLHRGKQFVGRVAHQVMIVEWGFPLGQTEKFGDPLKLNPPLAVASGISVSMTSGSNPLRLVSERADSRRALVFSWLNVGRHP